LYCDDAGKCTAECSEDSAASDCGTGGMCTADGHCNGGTGDGDGDGDGDGTGDGDGDGDGSGDGDGDACPVVNLQTDPVRPNVLFIIDRSGSMDAVFDGGLDRWDALRNVLLANGGILDELSTSADFGVVMYTGTQEGQGDGAMCPLLVTVDVAMNNLDDIRSTYSATELIPNPNNPNQKVGDTPTGESIEAILASDAVKKLAAGDRPTVFILATDGDPDTCAEPNSNGTEPPRVVSVDAVKHAYQAGIKTYVIAVAPANEIDQGHLDDLAAAGQNMPGAQPFRESGVDALTTTLRSIVTGELSCDVPIKGMVTATDPCSDSHIKLDGKELACGAAATDGWELVGESTLRLKGQACTDFKKGQKLDATFPCGGAVPVL
jgi:hypothetical protein